MKLHEEFSVDRPAEAIWSLFEQPDVVSGCMPGVEAVTVIDDDNVSVRATQSIGPMSATFEAKVTVLERVPQEMIRFQAIGKSVRGAVGNLRSTNVVRLVPTDGSTTVTVDGEVVLAGALGSVGQKIVARQANKVTAEFARNLERVLNGERPRDASSPDARQPGDVFPAPTGGAPAQVSEAETPGAGRNDLWVRVADVLSAASAVLSIVAIVRSFRRDRGRP
jgi:carbon monoxide dehydrogenase subunit G